MYRLLVTLSIMIALASFGAAHAADSRTLTFGGRERSYLVYRPAGLNGPAPLVVVMHGGFGTGSQAEHSYGWDAMADRGHFVVVYPDGVRRAWNAGGKCCGRPERDNIDDVGFLTALIKTVSHAENIDPKRVYLTGMSNGAAMSYRYACEGTFPIAAIGPVSGSFSYSCPKPHAVSVMEIHGLNDHNIPFNGGHGNKAATDVQWLGVDKSLVPFHAVDDCPPPVVKQNGPVKTTSAHCAAGRDVILIAISGAGHQWPGSQRAGGFFAWLLRLDPPSTALDATSTLWDFFKAHRAD